MTETDDYRPRRRRRGIYLLPNLLTTVALFSGFYAITAALNGRFDLAVLAIFVSVVMDGLDGRVARLTNTESEFGAQYDSLADMISFGAAPALVMYIWSLSTLGKFGWFAAFVHAAGGALRLARFNTQLATQVATHDKRYFQGLPSPAAAGWLASFLWVSLEFEIAGESLRFVTLILTLATGLLMVSNIRYLSFKEINFRGKVPFVVAIPVMLSLGLIFADPPLMFFLLGTIYCVSGLVITLVLLRRRRLERKS